MNAIDGIFWIILGVFVPVMCILAWIGSEADWRTSSRYRPDTPEEAEITQGCGWTLFAVSLLAGALMVSHGVILIFGLPFYLSVVAIVLGLVGLRIGMKKSKAREKAKEKKKPENGFIHLSDGQIAEVIEDDVIVPLKKKRLF